MSACVGLLGVVLYSSVYLHARLESREQRLEQEREALRTALQQLEQRVDQQTRQLMQMEQRRGGRAEAAASPAAPRPTPGPSARREPAAVPIRPAEPVIPAGREGEAAGTAVEVARPWAAGDQQGFGAVVDLAAVGLLRDLARLHEEGVPAVQSARAVWEDRLNWLDQAAQDGQLDESGDDGRGRHLIARTWLIWSEPGRALVHLRWLAERAGVVRLHWLELAGALRDLGDWATARGAVDRALLLAPDDAVGLLLAGQIALGAGDVDRAKVLLEGVRGGGSLQREALRMLTGIHLQAGALERAVQAGEQALALPGGASDAELAVVLGEALARLDQWERARAVLEKFSEVDEAALWLGRAELALGDAAGAARVLRALADRRADWSEAALAAAEAMLESGDLFDARVLLHRSIALEPSAAAWVLLGRLENRAGRLDHAEQALRQAVRTDPGQCLARVALAAVLLEMRMAKAAAAELQEAARVDPATTARAIAQTPELAALLGAGASTRPAGGG